MKTLKISAILCAAALALGITSCQTKELDTNQYSDTAVTLASFGPNPVVRGSQLRFFGSNLQNIVEVNLPGMDAITDIEVVEKGKVSEIRVTVPVEGPMPGIVTLKAKDGSIYKTRKELTFTEGIEFESFTAPAAAFPGDIVTLKGDYMHLAHHVIFEGGEMVPVEEGSTRHEAKVKVPATAVTGKIIISDGAEVEGLFYSEKELVIGKPTVTKVASVQNVKVGDEITLTGKHVEMISHFVFTMGEGTVDADQKTLAEDNNSLKFVVPAEATDGIVKAVSFAGDEFEACTIKCIMPENVAVTNTPKAGQALVITGKNLDVVTKVNLSAAENASFELKDGAINVTVPATATAGKVELFHANGTSVSAEYTLVEPVISSVAPLELFAGDEPVIVKGTDLDLVVKAEIGGKAAEIDPNSTDKELILKTAVTSVGGKVVLTIANSKTFTSTEEVVMKYHSQVIVTSRPDGQHIGEIVALEGTNMDLVETIYVGDAKVTKYALRTPEKIEFIMPWNKVGPYELKFVLFNGDEEIQPAPINVELERAFTTYVEGSYPVTWGETKIMTAAQVAELVNGEEIHIYYDVDAEPNDGYTQIRMIGDGWSFNDEGNPKYQWDPMGSGIAKGASGVIVKIVDQELKTNCVKGISLVGNGCVVTKVESVREISQEKTIWEGEAIATGWANQPYLLSDGGAELEGVEAGATAHIYFEPIDAGAAWKIQFVEGHWGDTYCSLCSIGADTESGKFTEYDLAANGGNYGLVLTEQILSAARTVGGWGGVFVANGDNVKITKITVQ